MSKSNDSRIPGRALVCTRRLLSRNFHEVASRVFSGDIYYFSDLSPSLEAHNLKRSFYEHYRRRHLSQGLTADDLNQVIGRDRVLRVLPGDQAERMVHAMKLALEEMTDDAQPDYLLSSSVDCYMPDLLFRICRERGITAIGIIAATVSGRCRVTSYGEFRKVCDPEDADIDMSLTDLEDDGQRVIYSSYKQYSALTHFGYWATHWGKAALFQIMSATQNDPLNFRYMAHLRSTAGHRDVFTYRCLRLFDRDWEAKARSRISPNLFIPLSHTPECSTDYWLNDLKYVDYERFILDSCRELAPYYQILVKEHWSMIGHRRVEFYEQLKQIPGVALIPVEVNSRLVMQEVDRILVGTGTPGIEGALRGKRVATLGTAYYDVEGYFLRLESADEIKDLPDMLEAHHPPEVTRQNQRALVRRLLEPTFPGYVTPGPHLNTRDNWETLSRSIVTYLSGPYFDRARA